MGRVLPPYSFMLYVLTSDALNFVVNTVVIQYTEVHFASFLSGGFITAISHSSKNPLAKRTSVQ